MGETLIIIVKFPDSLKLLVLVIYVATVNDVTEAEERDRENENHKAVFGCQVGSK